MKKTKTIPFLLILISFSIFTFTIVKLVPYQGDDFWQNYYHHQGFGMALSFFKWSYFHHVSRPGEFIGILLGDDAKLWYSCFAAVFMLITLVVIFALGMGRLPSLHSQTATDSVILITLFLALFLFFPFSGIKEDLLTLAGGSNHLLAILPAAVLIPYLNLLFNRLLIKSHKKNTSWLTGVFFLYSILAGYTVEDVPPAVVTTAVLCLSIYVVKYRQRLPLWSILGLAGLLLGWSIIVLAPGPLERAQHVATSHYFFQTSWIHKILESFLLTAKGFLTFRAVPLILFVVFAIKAYYHKKDLWVPLLLLTCCWLTDQAYVFAVGKMVKGSMRFGGSIFLFAALINLTQYYVFASVHKIKIILICLFVTFTIFYGYTAYRFHLQGQFRQDLITQHAITPTTTLPAYYGVTPLLKMDLICPNICAYGLPLREEMVIDPSYFFAQPYVSNQYYKNAQPLPLSINQVQHNGAKGIMELRWYPALIAPAATTGFQGLTLKGLLFMTIDTNKLKQAFSLYHNVLDLMPLYQISRALGLKVDATHNIAVDDYPETMKFNLTPGKIVLAIPLSYTPNHLQIVFTKHN